MRFITLRLRTLALSAVLAVVGAVLLSGCGGGDKPSGLVGNWVHYEGVTRGKPEAMELFKDGTGVVDGGSVTWKVENKRFVLLSAMGGLSCDYKVSGYELVLAYDGGDSATFVKKENLEGHKKKNAEPKAQMSEASRVLVSFESATLAALAELGSTYTKGDIVFVEPTDSRLFIYEVGNDIKTCKAEAKVNIGDFKKGDQIATMYDDKRGTFVHSSTNEAARKIIPEFFQDGMVTIRR